MVGTVQALTRPELAFVCAAEKTFPPHVSSIAAENRLPTVNSGPRPCSPSVCLPSTPVPHVATLITAVLE